MQTFTVTYIKDKDGITVPVFFSIPSDGIYDRSEPRNISSPVECYNELPIPNGALVEVFFSHLSDDYDIYRCDERKKSILCQYLMIKSDTGFNTPMLYTRNCPEVTTTEIYTFFDLTIFRVEYREDEIYPDWQKQTSEEDS